MKIIALDSSGLAASVAVMEDEICVAEYTTNYKKTHSQTLLPMLDEITKMIDLDLSTVDAIAIAAGPGSFTGLRIGSATAKGLGLALKKPIVAVPTVDALAYQFYGSDRLICPLMDARRNQVYTGLYQFEPREEGFQCNQIRQQCVVAIDEIIDDINCLAKEVIFLGDGLPVYRDKIRDLCKVPYAFASAAQNRQRAACVGVLAFEYIKEGKIESAAEHAPEYLRLSQAERERAEQTNANP